MLGAALDLDLHLDLDLVNFTTDEWWTPNRRQRLGRSHGVLLSVEDDDAGASSAAIVHPQAILKSQLTPLRLESRSH